MLAFGTMSFIMSASPLAIVGCGFPHAEAHWVIFMHVLGMFVPSFFTGNLINRFGATTVMAWGVVLMLAGVVAALSGLTEWNFRIALTVNGIGWNFLFVGATTLVTTCYRPNERGKSQALNDLLVFSTTATSSFMAGFLQDRWGWQPLNWFSVLLMLAAACAVLWLRNGQSMWKTLWQKWTIDKPAALGDWLWDVFVVQLAAFLDRLTLRKVIAFIPVIILIWAYSHRIPVSPALMLVGDLLAYIDIFAMLFLLGVLSRIETISFMMKQATARAARLISGLLEGVQRLDFRHRREGGVRSGRRLTRRAADDEGRHVVIHGVAWA
jgi:MFS family permease